MSWWQSLIIGITGSLLSLTGVIVTLIFTNKRERQRSDIAYLRAHRDWLRDRRAMLYDDLVKQIMIWGESENRRDGLRLDGELWNFDARMQSLASDDLLTHWRVYKELLEALMYRDRELEAYREDHVDSQESDEEVAYVKKANQSYDSFYEYEGILMKAIRAEITKGL